MPWADPTVGILWGSWSPLAYGLHRSSTGPRWGALLPSTSLMMTWPEQQVQKTLLGVSHREAGAEAGRTAHRHHRHTHVSVHGQSGQRTGSELLKESGVGRSTQAVPQEPPSDAGSPPPSVWQCSTSTEQVCKQVPNGWAHSGQQAGKRGCPRMAQDLGLVFPIT